MRAVLSLAADSDRICLDRAPGYNRLANVLEKLDIPMVDLLPAFRAVMPEGHVQLFRRDGHWSQAGHALAAKTVLGAIERGHWLEQEQNVASEPEPDDRNPS